MELPRRDRGDERLRSGELRNLIKRLELPLRVVSLCEELGAGPSCCAAAHAVAVLAAERETQ